MAYSAFAHVYDRLTENVEYEKRANYICSLLNLGEKSGSLLLDLACGTGSLSLEFCKRGFKVIGVDSSPDMLSIAQNKLANEGYQALLLCQDMRELDLHGGIDFAVCTLDSLNHITNKAGILKTFQRVSKFLNPDGIFVFDVNTFYKHEQILADNCFIYEDENVFCAWQNFYEGQGRVDICLDVFIEEKGVYSRYSEEFSEQAYSNDFLKNCLQETGFELISIYDEMSFMPAHEKSERLFFTAKKLKE